MSLYVGLDIGGTKTVAGLVRVEGRSGPKATVLASAFEPTAKFSRSAAFGQLASLIGRLVNGHNNKISGIGAVAPGPLDASRGVVLRSPNLPGWENLPLGPWLARHFKLPVAIANDANAAALAEALWGAGKKKRFVFYATISTGIGTGLVIDKKLYTGKTGMALEGGHLTIDYKGQPCKCGLKGCIEAYASGPSLIRLARKHLPGMASIDPLAIQEKAAEGDKICKKLIQESATYLGIWLGNIVSLLDPDMIVLGGGISNFGEPWFNHIRKTMPRYSINPKAKNVPIVPAKLGRRAGILGAVAIYLDQAGLKK